MTVYRIRYIQYNVKENGEKVFVDSWTAHNVYASRAVAERYCVEDNYSNSSRFFEHEIIEQEVIDE